ncbi:Phage terminase-like protein, large subunit, contains N-terminal HTH domain [Kaistia soli DSM 19436]|uniref:Phage terminase-like protein, large subunit, contains N-terminal HTH domain n=1 Tax=Kaistia soli DSM 19436 TaxID=1122133 RepID=A0A1M5PPI0_9HYPH|nr:terminase TerL endonuclease subunit [Kaistia soli]SHH03611.1 Phage terminase-like protein, large subunit, contains N-terminal HTH domain [Kaistia soli DSM 19436]
MAAAATFPHWIYDGSEIPDPFGYGERAVRFLKALRHPKNLKRGHPFVLDAWQERIVRRIYGPRHEDGTRIVKTVVLLLPRGNRKTSLSAALALLHTVGPERVPGGEVISAASDRKQARLAYAEALGIVRATAPVASVVSLQDYRNRLTSRKHGSFYEAISCDAGTQHGRTPVFVLADELHAWKKRDLWDVLKSGLVKTPGSLLVVATTAGRGQENVAFDIVDYARKVARGEIHDPATLPILFETDPDTDWRDEAVWHRANPGLSCSPAYPDIEGLRQLAAEAEHRPGDREAFRQLNLNVWLDHSADPFVEMAIYDQGAEPPVDLEALKGEPCWLGVDLSSNSDLTVVVAAWRDGDGYVVHPWFFCPEQNLRGRADRDGVPYPRWKEEGFITATPGNVVDFRAVEEKIRELCDAYDVREIAFDPHLARNMMANLAEDGFPAIEMRQGWITMAPAIKELERAIIAGRLRHGGNPILRWHFENISVETDKAGNKSFHKGKSRDRIDGAVAAAMAVGRASAGSKKRYSIYSDPRISPEDLWI